MLSRTRTSAPSSRSSSDAPLKCRASSGPRRRGPLIQVRSEVVAEPPCTFGRGQYVNTVYVAGVVRTLKPVGVELNKVSLQSQRSIYTPLRSVMACACFLIVLRKTPMVFMRTLVLISLLGHAGAFTLAPAARAGRPNTNKELCMRHLSARMTATPRAVSVVKSAATIAICLTLALGAPAPSLAKGGGHGGGGHSSGVHSSVSRSHHAPSAPRSYRAPSAPRSYRAPSATSSRSSSRSSSRQSSRSSSKHGRNTGTTSWHSSDVAAPPPPPPRTLVVDREPTVIRRPVSAESSYYWNGYWDGVWSARLEALTVGAVAFVGYARGKTRTDDEDGEEYAEGAVDYERELGETRALMRELAAELAGAPDPLLATIERPADGDYVGESAEDDDGDQAVRTTLTFGRDGIVSGSGFDGVDGAYVVSYGRWAGKRVAWIETYDEGFTVVLRGQVRPDGGILALWASSRGVGGSVELRPPEGA